MIDVTYLVYGNCYNTIAVAKPEIYLVKKTIDVIQKKVEGTGK